MIELRAHTDSRGDDSYNMELSQRRAQSCIDYLISKGVDPSRLRAQGYGESLPRVTEEQIQALPSKEAKEKAHQMNRRTEFVVLSFDFIPAGKIEQDDSDN